MLVNGAENSTRVVQLVTKVGHRGGIQGKNEWWRGWVAGRVCHMQKTRFSLFRQIQFFVLNEPRPKRLCGYGLVQFFSSERFNFLASRSRAEAHQRQSRGNLKAIPRLYQGTLKALQRQSGGTLHSCARSLPLPRPDGSPAPAPAPRELGARRRGPLNESSEREARERGARVGILYSSEKRPAVAVV